MAGERQLQPSPERCALNGRDDRLVRRLHARLDLTDDRRFVRQPRDDLVDVRTRGKHILRSRDDHRHHGRLARGLPQSLHQPLTHLNAQGIHGRIVDFQDGHIAFQAIAHDSHSTLLDSLWARTDRRVARDRRAS